MKILANNLSHVLASEWLFNDTDTYTVTDTNTDTDAETALLA